jgi:glycosyltransferase involved in cell wall biosynthesis
MKKITAVLPTIGRMQYLDVAIESLIKQSKPFDEIIIFDNSLEQKVDTISRFGRNNFVKFIRSGKQLAPVDSWNNAVRSASNEYVTIIGDDDVLLPNYCESIHEILKNSEVGILKAYSIDENGKEKSRLLYPNKKKVTDKDFRKLRFFSQLALFVPGIVFKKRLFLNIEGFKNTYMDGLAYSDELLLTQLSFLCGNVALSEKICWHYRIHSGQIGGVKDISDYVDKAEGYVELFEKSLMSLGASRREIYNDFTRQDYLDKVCRFGITNFSGYIGKNGNIITLIRSLFKYCFLDSRISLGCKFMTIALSFKSFFRWTPVGKILKKIYDAKKNI